MRPIVLALMLFAGLAAWLAAPVAGAPRPADAFQRVWSRADRPVAELRADRTWIWGPDSFSAPLLEDYDEAPEGKRVVQYFDKSRMEITRPEADPESVWYVTNGLLVKELVTGYLQLGDNRFEQAGPAHVNAAGDPDDTNAPTYASFASVVDYRPTPDGWTLIQTIDRNGSVSSDQSMASFGVFAANLVPETRHTVASVFWEFMNSRGEVYDRGTYRQSNLFESPFYATGYPLTEPYWTTVKVGGEPRRVLVQVFERRVLTYTPGNPPGWEVEAGNVGQHYFQWRYANQEPIPAPLPPATGPVIVLDPGHDASTGGAGGVEFRHTMQTAFLTKEALEDAGYTVYLTRPDNDAILYGDPGLMPPNARQMDSGYNEGYVRATRALQLRPDLFISIHYNAAGSSSVGGLTAYYCDYGGTQNAQLARLLAEELRAALRSAGYEPPYAVATEDGAIGKTYGHLATLGNVYSAPFAFEGNRLTGVPSVLTEALFETNPTERAVIESESAQRALARAYVRAVDRYFGR